MNNIYNTGGGGVDSAYLNTNNSFTASVITGNVATFVSRYIIQPSAGSTLPPTSITNFTLYRNGQYDLGTYWSKSKKENKPLYVLKYVTIKNGEKRYSEEGLIKMKEMYPDLVYKK